MALVVRLESTDDLAEIVEALLTAAEAKEADAPALTERWRTLAHNFGDALDALPQPTQ
ncbi:hypothetical protein QBB34_21235 [Streptomyces stelliscabiei]|uniref:hypothetical protein n=1 Tax=Streptomyces stelliscabiei TaxID=146820 RepID=UPI002FF08B28